VAYPPLEWTPELIKRFWDYQSVHGAHHYFAKMASPALLRVVQKYLGADPAILDYGCGPGYLTEELLKRGYRVFGYDASPHSIQQAKDRLRSFPRVLGLSTELPTGQTYDVLFALELVEHLSDGALENVLRAFRDLLKPEGLLVLTTPYQEDLTASTVYCPQCDHVYHRMQHMRAWSAESLTAYLAKWGFHAMKVIRTDLTARYSGRPWVRLKYWLGGIKPTNLICVSRLRPG
jgi:2-polyprenyl-3-methyl-5-hydroxy-6-metoxy-1,4-benzoquinol methylase